MSQALRPRLILLPGLGADARLFARQRELPLELELIEWPRPQNGETLARYVGRLAAAIDTSRPFFLGGVSFGGMVALQLASLIKPQGVILIASCRCPHELPEWYAPAAGGMLQLAPAYLGMVARGVPLFKHFFGPLNAEAERLMDALMADGRPELLAWQLAALGQWSPAAKPAAPVFHIHGRLDRIIPLRALRPDRIVEDAGHLVNITHAEVVNRFILDCMGGAGGDGEVR